MPKACAHCRQTKPNSAFYRDGKRLQSWCKDCKRQHMLDNPAVYDKHRGTVRMRRIKLCHKHAECAIISRAEVLRRGNGICGICGKPVRKRWHMDHIIPVSKGGVHCYLNLQPSHIRCNLRKGNKVAL